MQFSRKLARAARVWFLAFPSHTVAKVRTTASTGAGYQHEAPRVDPSRRARVRRRGGGGGEALPREPRAARGHGRSRCRGDHHRRPVQTPHRPATGLAACCDGVHTKCWRADCLAVCHATEASGCQHRRPVGCITGAAPGDSTIFDWLRGTLRARGAFI